MSRQSVMVIGVTAAVGLGLVVAAASVASAGPPAVGALIQRIEMVHTTIPANAHTTVEATCDANEVVTGGGYVVYSIGPYDKVFANAPADERTWHVQIINETAHGLEVDVYAVCLSRAGSQ